MLDSEPNERQHRECWTWKRLVALSYIEKPPRPHMPHVCAMCCDMAAWCVGMAIHRHVRVNGPMWMWNSHVWCESQSNNSACVDGRDGTPKSTRLRWMSADLAASAVTELAPLTRRVAAAATEVVLPRPEIAEVTVAAVSAAALRSKFVFSMAKFVLVRPGAAVATTEVVLLRAGSTANA